MAPPPPVRVTLDGAAFFEHRRSGITRYLTELIKAFDDDASLGIDLRTPYRYVANLHATSADRGFRSIPLPRRWRRPVLDRLNEGRRVAEPGDGVAHLPLYDEALLAEAGRRPSVTTVYDFTFEVFPELFGDVSVGLELKRRFLEECDVLICISEATRRDLARFHPDLDKQVVVTPLAVSSEFARPTRPRSRRLPERYVLHVGNRTEHKNVDLLFRSFRSVMSTDPDLMLVLCGQGMAGEEERLADLGILGRTRILRLSDAELPGAYRDAAAFVFPSRYEGFGLPVLEAMAAGAPTLVADTPAVLEVAGDAAIVLDPDDEEGAAASLEHVLGDQRLAARLRQDGRGRAADFSWARTARLTAEAYRLAATSGPGRGNVVS